MNDLHFVIIFLTPYKIYLHFATISFCTFIIYLHFALICCLLISHHFVLYLFNLYGLFTFWCHFALYLFNLCRLFTFCSHFILYLLNLYNLFTFCYHFATPYKREKERERESKDLVCGAASWHASLYIRKHKQPRDMMWYVTAVHDQRCMGMTWASAAVLPDSHPASSPQITHMFTNYLDSNASILKRIALSPPLLKATDRMIQSSYWDS